MQNSNRHIDIYETVTNKIIEHLEKGVVPWQQPWSGGEPPQNLISKKPYRGINVLLLNTLGYSQNHFLTFHQIKELGGSVKRGEKAQIVMFWKQLERDNDKGEKERIPFLRYYTVFNISQCTGIPESKLPKLNEIKHEPIKECEEILSKMPNKPEIKHELNRAFYNKAQDFINMPKPEIFNSSESYYATLFHEIVHSTGHEKRLNRKELLESRGMRSDNYALEELTAEMGSSFLCNMTGIEKDNIDNSASYINSWLERLKNDKKFIFYASSQAQKSVDFVLDVRERELDIVGREEELEKLRVSKIDIELSR